MRPARNRPVLGLAFAVAVSLGGWAFAWVVAVAILRLRGAHG